MGYTYKHSQVMIKKRFHGECGLVVFVEDDQLLSAMDLSRNLALLHKYILAAALVIPSDKPHPYHDIDLAVDDRHVVFRKRVVCTCKVIPKLAVPISSSF